MVDLLQAFTERLALVHDPELRASIVDLGMVGDVHITTDGVAHVEVALTTAACPLRSTIEASIQDAGRDLPGIRNVQVRVTAMDPAAKAALLQRARGLAQALAPTTTVPRQTPVFMIASGKGGVGKSSITANLAVALARRGQRVGVLDADIWGFSLARLLDVHGDVQVRQGRMVPNARPEGRGSIALLSMGHLADEDQALLWRGLMVQKAVAQFIEDADWSGVDTLLIDTPPGTGDISMTLSRLLPQLGVIVVTTPAAAAQHVAARAADFARKSNLRLVGVIENMSPFHCACGARHAVFGEGGGQALADQYHVDLLAAIPLRAELAHGGDAGHPVAADEASAGVFTALADTIAGLGTSLVPAGCSARLLDALDASVRATHTDDRDVVITP